MATIVVEVREFESGKLAYEIYTFGEENVVIPIDETSKSKKSSGVDKLAEERIAQVFRKYDPDARVRILSSSKAEVSLDEAVIPRVIGRGGTQIKEIEQSLSMGIDIRARDGEEEPQKNDSLLGGKKLKIDFREKANSLEIFFDADDIGKEVQLGVDGQSVISSKIGQKARLKFSKKSELGKKLSAALRSGSSVEAYAD